MPIERKELAELLDFAVELAREAGRTTLRYFRTSLDVEEKSDRSPVTVADRETETFIRDAVVRRFPDHRIVGEEHGETNPDGRLSWVIDPIDGTKSFIRGVPLYTVLIALLDGDRPVLGVIHCPPLEETVAAATGLGCTYNGDPCHVSAATELSSAMVLTSDYCELARREPAFARLLFDETGMGRTWADGYGYLLAATGRADAMVDPIMNLWDIAPLEPVITEAGGAFSDLHGRTGVVGDSALAAPPALHRAIVSLHHAEPRGGTFRGT